MCIVFTSKKVVVKLKSIFSIRLNDTNRKGDKSIFISLSFDNSKVYTKQY